MTTLPKATRARRSIWIKNANISLPDCYPATLRKKTHEKNMLLQPTGLLLNFIGEFLP